MLKQRKHKTFNYKPRYSNQNNSKEGFDENSGLKNFESKWQREREGNLVKGKRGFSLVTLILILVLLLICMYILENEYM